MDKFKKLVMSILKLDNFPVKDGKIDFSEEQKNILNSEFSKMGTDFLGKFEEAMNAEIANKSAQEQADSANALLDSVKLENGKQIELLQSQLKVAETKGKELEQKVQKLIDASESDIEPEGAEGAGKTKIVAFKPDMKMAHNKMAKGYTEGTLDLSVSATTMDVSELATEFGSYMSQFGISLEIIKKLTQATETEKFMTTKLAITEWKASKALISSVVQQFSAKWTPLGQAKFTPIVIKNRRHKINVPLTPDEIMDGWLAYLYDETLSPEQMPVTKYIVEQLILPKVAEDRELRLIGKGVYEELVGVNENDPGQATGKSMDGFITILKNEKASGTSAISFIDLATLTDENIVDEMNKFVDGIDELYQDKPMPIFCSMKLYKMYKRAYQKLYPVTKNNDETDDNIDFSPQRLQKLPSMAGEMVFFCTPKENFIRLQHKNSGASKIFMEKRRYDVEVMAEWWEAPGFAVAEAVFAYVPDEDSQSGS